MSSNLTPQAAGAAPPVDAALTAYTHVIYALHTLAVLIGVTTAATVVGSFVCGIPSVVAVIMNYARRSATRGTFLESHFRWQIRTFWFALLWAVVIYGVAPAHDRVDRIAAAGRGPRGAGNLDHLPSGARLARSA